jgi:aminoglycoside 6'-N-acetyltransferase
MAYPLLTPRLSIEPLKLSDLNFFVDYRQDPEIARFQGWDSSYSVEQAVELIDSQAGLLLPSQGQWLQLGVREKISGELVGDLALHCLIESEPTFEIGFTIARKHQGKGFAKESASRLMNYLFFEVGAKEIVANTDRRNTSSVNLLLSLGFKRQTSKSWTENFKNELVTVDYYDCRRQSFSKP